MFAAEAGKCENLRTGVEFVKFYNKLKIKQLKIQVLIFLHSPSMRFKHFFKLSWWKPVKFWNKNYVVILFVRNYIWC